MKTLTSFCSPMNTKFVFKKFLNNFTVENESYRRSNQKLHEQTLPTTDLIGVLANDKVI